MKEPKAMQAKIFCFVDLTNWSENNNCDELYFKIKNNVLLPIIILPLL